MNDLVTWLRAQLDDDERAAREASPGPWSPNAESDEVLAIDGERVADGFALSGRQLRATVEHISRHDPARVLAEVDVKRRILDRHALKQGERQRICAECGGRDWKPESATVLAPFPWVMPWPCPTLRLLALPYADRPGYRDEWKP